MSFNSYKNITEVLQEFSLTYRESCFVEENIFEIDPNFLSRFNLTLKEGVVFNSEYAICENIISPILREVWLKYTEQLILEKNDATQVELRLESAIAKAFEQISLVDFHHWFTHGCYCEAPYSQSTC